MSFTNDIRIMALGSLGSQVATIIGRYQREGNGSGTLSNVEKRTLERAVEFVQNLEQGYQAVNSRNFTMNSEESGSYNYYLQVRQKLPELGTVSKASEIKKEIEMFANVLRRLNEEKALNQAGRDNLGKVAKFFSTLSDFALEQLYIINNRKPELEFI